MKRPLSRSRLRRRLTTLRRLRRRLQRRKRRSLELGALSFLEMTGGARIVYGNRIRLLVNGRDAFAAMEEAIRQARATVSVEMYLWRNDRMGRRLAALLAQRAREGIQVRIVYDAFGTLGSEAVFQPIREAGGRVLAYGPLIPVLGRLYPGLRDHRKLLIVDGATAFVSSRNIGDEYTEEFSGDAAFRDLTVAIDGPAVRECLKLFVKSWLEIPPRDRGPEDLDPLLSGPLPAEVGAAGVQFLGLSRGPRGRRTMRNALVAMIRVARREILFAHAYFFPDHSTLRALRAAARRGVAVTILLPSETDVTIAREAGRSFYGRLLNSGIGVRERASRMLHMKVGLIDEEAIVAGSANLDTLSLFRNKEIAVNIFDMASAVALRRELDLDLRESVRITQEEWNRRGRLRRFFERVSAWLRAWY